jgi:uncharacterized protein YjiK
MTAAWLVAGCGGGDDDAPSGPPPTTLKTPALSFTAPQATIDLANYYQVGRYSLPVGTGTNLLADEASAVTYNKDTDTLFVMGDEGTSITQVTKQGVLVDSMTLGADAALPDGTYFADPEGLSYIGGGRFVMAQERLRRINQFTYKAGTTLTAADVKSVTLGTTVGNIGIEGISFDPSTSGYLLVKESGPSGIFQTTIDFTALTASNGSPTTENSTNLFDPAKAGLAAFSDVYALSNVLAAASPSYGHFLIVSGPDGKLRELDRSGNVVGTLDVGVEPQNEGVTMDGDLNIYVVNEVGGGTDHPEMLVYSPTKASTAVGKGSNLYLAFDQTVVAGVGNITLSNGAGDTRTIAIGDATQVHIQGSTVTIDPSTDLLAGTTYTVTYAAGLLKDAAGADAPALTSAAALSFKVVGVVDTAAPLLVGTTPVDNATGVGSGALTLSFNEAVKAGTGNIVIANGAGDARTIAIGDATQVTISGSTVSISPSTELVAGSTYNVQLAAGVVTDAAGNAFAGIADATTFNFTLAPAAPTTLAAGDLLFMAANADPTDAFAFVLLKGVTAGTQIGFTDRDYSATTGMPASGESAYMWSADVAYPAGTIITIQVDQTTPIADKGTVMGAGGGISTSAETIYAFQGTITGLTATKGGAIAVDRFIAAVNIGAAAGDIPAALVTAGSYITFPKDNAKYNGSLTRTDLAAFAALVRDINNWVSDDATAYPVTAGSLFP